MDNSTLAAFVSLAALLLASHIAQWYRLGKLEGIITALVQRQADPPRRT